MAFRRKEAMQVAYLHCVYKPKQESFLLTVTVGKKKHQHKLTPVQFAEMLGHAKQQVADATDAMADFTFRLPMGSVAFSNGRDAFEQTVLYLDKVHDSWMSWKLSQK